MTDHERAASARRATPGEAHGLVLRNATWLVLAQALGAPLAIAVNAVMGRRLGAVDFGYIYLATTLGGLGLHLVDWGQSTALPGLVAVDRARAGVLLGSTLAWRAAASVLVFGGLAAGCHLAGCDPSLQVAVVLVGAAMALGSLARACQDAVRGLERSELAALAIAGQPLLTAAVVIPTLLLGGGLRAALGAQVAVGALGLAVLALALRPMGISGLAFRWEAVRRVVHAGSPFLVLGVAGAIHPNVDALLLSRLAPPEVMGWHAAAMKLVGALVFPVSSLIAALYPTLSRLHAEDREAYGATAAAALRTSTVLVVPLAAGCALYPEVGVAIFGEAAFGPARGNLLALAPYVFLLYGSMTLGCCLSAAGRQRAWALLQVACLGVAAALDLLLIPWFQARTGNGGLGVAASLVACEVLMVAGAAWLAPAGLMGRALLVTALRAAVAAAAMTLAAGLLRGLHPFAAAPLSVICYAAVLVVLGGAEGIGGLRELVRRSAPWRPR
jgi:O-antigen/teichoic acid export membrane protein